MILRPDAQPAHADNAFVSAWEAVARAEKTTSARYHLVRQPVEFPQCIGPKGGTVRLQVQDGAFALSPALFAKEVELSVQARPYPAETGRLSITIRWRVR